MKRAMIVAAALAALATAPTAWAGNSGNSVSGQNNKQQSCHGAHVTCNFGGGTGSQSPTPGTGTPSAGSKSTSSAHATSRSRSSATGGNSTATGGRGGSARATGGAGGTATATGNGGAGGAGGHGYGGSAQQSQSQTLNGAGNSTVTVQGDNFPRPPVAPAWAPPLTTGADTCMGSTSVGGQGITFGASFGLTWTDKNCQRIKNARELSALGLTDAALELLCQDQSVARAMDLSGHTCRTPYYKRKSDRR